MKAAGKRWMGLVAQLGCVVGMRLEERSVRIPFSGCQVWIGPTNGEGKYGRGGYGVVTVNGAHKYVHRLSYELNVGAIPKGMMVCHRCDVRACINPEHLFVSDARGNHQDKVSKGRSRSPGAPRGALNHVAKNPEMVRGENNGRAVLTAKDVVAIREAIARGVHQRNLAAMYGVGQSQISRIKRLEAWQT